MCAVRGAVSTQPTDATSKAATMWPPRLLDRANMRYQYGTDEYIALREQRNALRASWNAAQHPLAGHDAAAAFAIAETNAALAAERLLAGE